ncbi:MAG: hypothetical protein NC489_46550 [Ruminococcus flavefaciens]|nr:hypothetical protein [Ruminococcus flavefaciens]
MADEKIKKQEVSNDYPAVLDLDGVYVRVNRNKKWVNLCFSDLTQSEQEAFLSTLQLDGLKRLCCILARSLCNSAGEI